MSIQTITSNSILADTGKFGMRAVMAILLVVFLFVLSNLSVLGYSIHHFWSIESLSTRILASIGILIVGIAFTVLAAYLTYKYLIIYGLSLVYPRLHSFFAKLCQIIVNNVSMVAGRVHLGQKQIDKTFRTGDILNETYQRKTPWVVRKGISVILKLVPFVSILADTNLRNVLQSGNKEEAAKLLHMAVDNYIRTEIFETNTIKWIFLLFGLNVVVQGVIFYFVGR